MRQRATAVIIREGKVLLVRDRGHSKFSLPGGEINKDEPTISAVSRELFEELGLIVDKVTRLRHLDFKGQTNGHKVCLVETKGEPYLKDHELDKFIWWDMSESIPVYEHVENITSFVKRNI